MRTLLGPDAAIVQRESARPLSRVEKKKHLTISFRCGRLANRLVLFANLVALAEEQGHDLTNFTFHSYSEFFEGTRQNFYCRYPRPERRSWIDALRIADFLRFTRLPHHVTRYAALLNERYPLFGPTVATAHECPGVDYTLLEGPTYQEKISSARFVFVYGWGLRAPALVKKHADKIRDYFRPVEKFVSAAQAVIAPLRDQADVVIGVHIRQGDYRQWQGGKYFFETARYADWMRDLVAQFPDRKVAFLICSDEPRQLEEFAKLTVGFGSGTPVGDLQALSQCDYIIGPKSTFTQWASFYGDKPLRHLTGGCDPVRLEEFRVCYLDWSS